MCRGIETRPREKGLTHHAIAVAFDLLLQDLQARAFESVFPVAVRWAISDQFLQRYVVVGSATGEGSAASQGG